jgi:hypothetical protein
MGDIVDLVGITFSQALSSLLAHDVSMDVSTVEIPVGLKGKTYHMPQTEGLLDFAQQVTVLWNELLRGEDVFIGFSAPVAYVLC